MKRFCSNKLFTSLSENTDHAIFSLIGLKPETDYQYIVHAKINDNKIQSEQGQFQTGALPEGLPELTLNKNTAELNELKYKILKRKINGMIYRGKKKWTVEII